MESEHVELSWTLRHHFCNAIQNHHSTSGQKVSNPNVKGEQSSRSSPRRSHPSNGAVENSQQQLQGQVRTNLAAFQDRTQYRPTTDSALMKWIVRHAAWHILRFWWNHVQFPFCRAMGGPYLVNRCLLTIPVAGKRSGNPAPKLADRWKSAVWLGRRLHLVRTDEGAVHARSVRRLPEHSWSEGRLRAVVETPQRPKSTTVDIPPAAEPLAHPFAAPEVPEDGKEELHSETRGRRRNAAGAAHLNIDACHVTGLMPRRTQQCSDHAPEAAATCTGCLWSVSSVFHNYAGLAPVL